LEEPARLIVFIAFAFVFGTVVAISPIVGNLIRNAIVSTASCPTSYPSFTPLFAHLSNFAGYAVIISCIQATGSYGTLALYIVEMAVIIIAIVFILLLVLESQGVL